MTQLQLKAKIEQLQSEYDSAINEWESLRDKEIAIQLQKLDAEDKYKELNVELQEAKLELAKYESQN